jgi:hypothetical protein
LFNNHGGVAIHGVNFAGEAKMLDMLKDLACLRACFPETV